MQSPLKSSVFLIVALNATLLAASASVHDPRITISRVNPDAPVEVFGRVEFRVGLDDSQYDNPFDPTEISVDAIFRHMASGKQLKLPAFWDSSEAGQGGFKLRFSPTQVGTWEATVVARDRSGLRESHPVALDVVLSKRDGFVRRSPGARYLTFDSGKPFIPLGPNIAWTNSGGLTAYQSMFSKLRDGGGNYARVWFAHPNRPMETVAAGLGRYDLSACQYYDELLELADAHAIRVMVTLMNHRDLLERDVWGPAQWPSQPHNAANGGPCTQPADFISRSDMRELYKRRLRYMVARYSAFSSVAFWEFWNEQGFTDLNIPPDWTLEMAGYLREIDPYAHLITTSFGRGEQVEVWRSDNIDLTQHHYYGGGGVSDCSPAIRSFHREYAKFQKPSLMGELGIGWDGSDDKADPTGLGTNLHNGIWASLTGGGAGGASNWWWDNYIEKHNLWSVYRGAAEFVSRIPWTQRSFEPIDLAPVVDPAANADELADVQINLSGGWGKSHGQLIVVQPNGSTSREFPTYIYGYEQSSLRTPTTFVIDLPRPSKLVVDVAMVSDTGILRVMIDGKPSADWFFSALPGGADQEETKRLEGPRDIYQAKINKRRELELPAGKHTIGLANLGTDWISIAGLTIVGGRSKRFANADAMAIQDAAAGETLLWLRDLDSNWKADQRRGDQEPAALQSLEIRVPSRHAGTHRIEWWGTRSGELVLAEERTPTGGELIFRSPKFVRDIAARVTLIDGRTSAGG